MIQKIIGISQKLPIPFLGRTQSSGPSSSTGFVPPAPQVQKSLPILQSQTQQLNIQSQALKPGTVPPPAPTQKVQVTSPLQSIHKITQAQIVQHPVKSPVTGMTEQELLLLMALNSQAKVGKTPEDSSLLQPAQTAQLSFLSTEKPFTREKKKNSQLKVGGRAFVNFHMFDWDKEEESPSKENQNKDESLSKKKPG